MKCVLHNVRYLKHQEGNCCWGLISFIPVLVFASKRGNSKVTQDYQTAEFYFTLLRRRGSVATVGSSSFDGLTRMLDTKHQNYNFVEEKIFNAIWKVVFFWETFYI